MFINNIIYRPYFINKEVFVNKESRHDRFKRVAAKRVNDILEKIRILGNCSNKSSYEFTEEEVSKIFSEIDKQLKVIKVKFLAGKTERRFEL